MESEVEYAGCCSCFVIFTFRRAHPAAAKAKSASNIAVLSSHFCAGHRERAKKIIEERLARTADLIEN
jgi:hypothetical protein